jgi:hypothetical protein
MRNEIEDFKNVDVYSLPQFRLEETKQRFMQDSTKHGKKRSSLFSADPDAAEKRRARAATISISQREFAKRIRFRDENGYSYAVPLRSDPIFSKYATNGVIADAGSGDPDDEAPLTTSRVMLYLRKPRTKILVPLPTGAITLLDLESNRVFVAHVNMIVSSRMDKPGHIILDSLADTGRIAKKSDFTGQLPS